MRFRNGSTKSGLQKALGLAFGVAVVIGATIGVGILRAPSSIATLLPNATIILTCWILIGLYVVLAASQYAELTTMLPKAGGAYNYIKRAFGPYAGFINGWFDFFCQAISPAYFCMALSEFSALLLPALVGYKTMVALGYLTFVTVVNLPGIRNGSFVQQVTSAIKILLFGVLIGACFFKGSITNEALSVSAPLIVQSGLFVAFFKVLQLVIGTYDGWMAVSVFAEEDSNPSKNIPKSYLIGTLSVVVLYVLINAAVLYVLPVQEVAQTPLATARAADIVFGKWGGTFITVFALFSLLGVMNANMLASLRILFGLSRDGFFLKRGMLVNRGGTPTFALLCCYLLNIALIFVSSFDQLFALGAFMMIIVTLFAFLSLIRLRHHEPHLLRPYKAWGYPFTTYLTVLVTIILFVGFAISDWLSLLIVLMIALVSYPCYKLLMKTDKAVVPLDIEAAIQT